ncbi:hypothetical protein EVG20_g4952 [Dentipellis fragilis]|uniref:factor independent urate hydroxylase n=1 Tax=Dentipellis fragilis TaxID=205917 RepID=A0A4Y9YU89_9AGAM|nr:hypothetical protein EVG20_g4952 [Dentipellis fragilis]
MASNTTSEPGVLAHARYGKDKVRVFRVVREPGTPSVHRVVEYNVTALLEGAIDTSYTQADNSVVVATDSSAQEHHILHNPSISLLFTLFLVSVLVFGTFTLRLRYRDFVDVDALFANPPFTIAIRRSPSSSAAVRRPLFAIFVHHPPAHRTPAWIHIHPPVLSFQLVICRYTVHGIIEAEYVYTVLAIRV